MILKSGLDAQQTHSEHIKNVNNWYNFKITFSLETSGVKGLIYIQMFFFSALLIIRHLWKLKIRYQLELVSNMGRFIILNVIKSKEELNRTEPSTSFRIPWKKILKI
jgi:hypothetical protein